MTTVVPHTPELETIIRIMARQIAKKKAAEEHLRDFVRQSWHIVEPGRKLVPGFYIDAICDHLQAVFEGDLTRLVITLPPGFLKSTIVSVQFPAWMWIDVPSFRFLTTSHDSDLAMRDAVRSRRVMMSDWYQERWGNRFAMTTDQNVKTRYENDQTGHRISLGTGSGITGKRGDLIICDDPNDAEDAYNTAALASTVRWWNEVVPSRLNDPKTGAKIVIQQRLHVEDLAGEVISQGYEHLNLPMEYEPTKQVEVSSIGWSDPRTETGELLDPVRYGPAEIEEKKKELGSQAYEAQYQQRPVAVGGGIIKRWWIRYWQYPGQDLPRVVEKDKEGREVSHPVMDLPGYLPNQMQSWDLNFDETQSGSYVVGLQAASIDALVFLLDRYKDRPEFTVALQAFVDMGNKWPETTVKLVENKANGPALMSMLRKRVTGIVSQDPKGSKEQRMHAITPFVEGGGLVLPHPQIAPWVEDYVDQITTFPMAKHDDDADATSQLIQRVTGNAEDGMDNVVDQFLQNMGTY